MLLSIENNPRGDQDVSTNNQSENLLLSTSDLSLGLISSDKLYNIFISSTKDTLEDFLSHPARNVTTYNIQSLRSTSIRRHSATNDGETCVLQCISYSFSRYFAERRG